MSTAGQPRTIGVYEAGGARPACNNTGSTINKCTGVKPASSPTYADEINQATSGTGPKYGVVLDNNIADLTTGSIAAGTIVGYGQVATRGRVPAIGSTSITAGARVTVTTGGKFVTVSDDSTVWGIAATACSGTDAYFELDLDAAGGEAAATP